MNPALQKKCVAEFSRALAGARWANHIVYWIGPLAGGAAAGAICGRYLDRETKV
jgi:hypothetical protein